MTVANGQQAVQTVMARNLLTALPWQRLYCAHSTHTHSYKQSCYNIRSLSSGLLDIYAFGCTPTFRRNPPSPASGLKILLRNVGVQLEDYMAQHSIRPYLNSRRRDNFKSYRAEIFVPYTLL